MNPLTIKVACSNCNLRELCMPVGLSDEQLQRIDDVVAVRRKVKRGATLFRNGESFTSLYAIRTGFFKTCVATEDGRDQVTGFQMAGEIIGLDGIVNDDDVTVTLYRGRERWTGGRLGGRSAIPLAAQLAGLTGDARLRLKVRAPSLAQLTIRLADSPGARLRSRRSRRALAIERPRRTIGDSRARRRMPAGRPEVHTVIARASIASAEGSESTEIAASTRSRLASGSPMP